MSRKNHETAAPVNPTPETTQDGAIGSVTFEGLRYQLDRTRCAACNSPVLIASGHGRSALFASVTLQPSDKPIAVRHRCPAAATGRQRPHDGP